jgi:signal transduction histidine kinase
LAEIAIIAEVAKQRGLAPGLDLVATRARELRQAMSDIVWAVDPSGDNPENMINRWRYTAFALLGDDHLEFLAPKAEVSARVDLTSTQRHDLLLLFKEIVTNVARHASARQARIQIGYSSGWLKLEICDDGCGFDLEHAHAGNGLKSIRQRAQALRGSLTMESLPGRGTSVNLQVPLSSSRMNM